MPGWAMLWSARKKECQQSLRTIGLTTPVEMSHHRSSPWTLKRATLRLGDSSKAWVSTQARCETANLW
jgi:hypothetical protein